MLCWISMDHVGVSLSFAPNVGHKHQIRHWTHSKQLIFADKNRRRTALRHREGQTLSFGRMAARVANSRTRRKSIRKVCQFPLAALWITRCYNQSNLWLEWSAAPWLQLLVHSPPAPTRRVLAATAQFDVRIRSVVVYLSPQVPHRSIPLCWPLICSVLWHGSRLPNRKRIWEQISLIYRLTCTEHGSASQTHNIMWLLGGLFVTADVFSIRTSSLPLTPLTLSPPLPQPAL